MRPKSKLRRRHGTEGNSCPGCVGVPVTRRELLRQTANGFGITALSALMADPAYAGLSGL